MVFFHNFQLRFNILDEFGVSQRYDYQVHIDSTKGLFGWNESLGIFRNWNPIPKDSYVWLSLEMRIGISRWI